jgi:hypothetical protein
MGSNSLKGRSPDMDFSFGTSPESDLTLKGRTRKGSDSRKEDFPHRVKSHYGDAPDRSDLLNGNITGTDASPGK